MDKIEFSKIRSMKDLEMAKYKLKLARSYRKQKMKEDVGELKSLTNPSKIFGAVSSYFFSSSNNETAETSYGNSSNNYPNNSLRYFFYAFDLLSSTLKLMRK